MKVKELIKELQKFNEETEVKLGDTVTTIEQVYYLPIGMGIVVLKEEK